LPGENIIEKAALVNLILLYGFVISFYNGADFFQYSQVSGQQTQQQSESCQALVSKDLLSHTSSPETLSNWFPMQLPLHSGISSQALLNISA
jgi:hypothetical protein